MSAESIAMLVAGFAMIIAGFAIVAFREEVAERNRRNIDQKFGKLLPGFADGSTPPRMVPVGIVSIGSGLLLVVDALSD